MLEKIAQAIEPIRGKSTGTGSLKSTGLRQRGVVLLCLGWAMSGLSLDAQNVEDLQSEIQQMKQLYEQRIASLEGRIASLEKANVSTARAAAENVISSKDLPSEVAKEVTAQSQPKLTSAQRTEVEQTQLGTTPYYDAIQDSQKVVDELKQQVKAFEFHGYLRSGVGLNSEGGQMVAFQAPGAPAKYRLGNEAETYGEFIFVNNWINPSHDTDKAWMKTEVMLQANTTQSQNYASNDQFRLREAFIQVGDVLPAQPSADFWAGERYYRRQNIDINDFFVLDTSGYGGGFENLNLKFGQAAVAYLGGAKDDLITDNGVYPKSVLDARLYGIKVLGGELGLWYDYSFSKGGVLDNGTQVRPSQVGRLGSGI